jgi:5'-nucleotidase
MNVSPFFLVFTFVFSSSFIIGSSGEFRLLVIHNNDMHARFEQTNAYGAPCPPGSARRNRCYGGFARMKTAINEAVRDANQNNVSYVVLNAGDSFQGTPYYDAKKWPLVKSLLESLPIDVMVRINNDVPSTFLCVHFQLHFPPLRFRR